jgi:hypothetical protein
MTTTKTAVRVRAVLLASFVAALTGSTLAASPAADDASHPAYDAGWTNGQNNNTGFGPWVFYTQITQPNEGAGQFIATSGGNPDLNFIATGAPGRAWGQFANEAFTGGNDLQLAAAIRPFTGGGLEVGQTFSIRFEHGFIQSGNLNPEFGPRIGGWVGVTLRTGTIAQFIEDPLQPFGNISGNWGFGFQGGQQNYLVYDAQSPSGRQTNVPFTVNGLTVQFTLTEKVSNNSFNYTAIIKNAETGAILDTITGPVSGVLDAFGLYNRNAELADVFFNSAAVTNAPVPCCSGNADKVAPGTVEFADITSVLANFGAGYGITGPGDADCDGNVTFGDITAVLANFNAACN